MNFLSKLFKPQPQKVDKETEAKRILLDFLDSTAKSRIEQEVNFSRLYGETERAKKLENMLEKLSQANASGRDYRMAYDDFIEKEDKDKVLKTEELIMDGHSSEDVLAIFSEDCSKTTISRILKKAINLVCGDISNSQEINIDKEAIIDDLRNRYGISDKEFQRFSNYSDYIKTLQVQDMLQGNTPKRFTLMGVPINLQKNETPIWAFSNTAYYEEKKTRTYVGGSSGFSIRLAKGVYYRIGAFRGEAVEKSNLTHLYSGTMVLTDKNIYFYSKEKSIKFPYSKIVSYIPFEDGIGIQLDRVNSKPVYIQNIDGRFAYNIVSNINNLS